MPPAITNGSFQYEIDCCIKYQPGCIYTKKADAEKEHGEVSNIHNRPDSEKKYEGILYYSLNLLVQ